MALEAGEMAITVEYAKDLKDKDFFGKQDPYCIIKVGSQQYRTRTAKDGGKNPVWNETFKFSVLNENDAEVIIKDDDVGHDDYIGTTRVSLAKAREYGRDQTQAAVYTKSGKQHGFVQVALIFTRNASLKAGAHGAYPGAYMPQQYAQYPYPQQIPGYGAPPGYAPPYGAPPTAYGAPPPAYGAPPPGAAYPPGGASYPPQQSYPPPGQYGAPPPGHYGAPNPGQYGAPAPGQYGAPPPYGAQPPYGAPPAYPNYR